MHFSVLWKFPSRRTASPFDDSPSGNFLTMKISPNRLSLFNICILHRLFLSICSLECEGETVVLQVGVLSVWLPHTKIMYVCRGTLGDQWVYFQLQLIRTQQDSKIPGMAGTRVTQDFYCSNIDCGEAGCQKLLQS